MIPSRFASCSLLALLLAAGPALASPKDSALVQAVQDGISGKVEALIAAHADVNATDDAGVSAISWAVMRGDGAMMARLLKARANPNQTDANNGTPLMLAIESGNVDAVRLLLEAGADANHARPNGETPLMMAVHEGDAAMVALLLAHKADVNAREAQFGQTALMLAGGHPAIVRQLLDAHADTAPLTKSWTVTATIFTPTTTTLGVTGIPWNNKGDYTAHEGRFNALMFAVQANDIESVRMLLDAGLDVNAKSSDGTTPLLLSLYHWRYVETGGSPTVRFGSRGVLKFSSDIAIANLLLDHGAQVNVADVAGYTPLHGAVLSMMGNLDLVPGARMAFKPPPLVHADDGLALVDRLLKAGADPNRATLLPTGGPVGDVRVNPLPPGSTPFHAAAMVASGALADLMAAHGADPNKLRQDGHSPFSVAARYDNLPVVQSMVAHGADLKKLYDPQDQLADTVLSKTELRKGQSVLHIAGANGGSHVIGFLIASGVSPDIKNDHGETAYKLASDQELFRYKLTREGGTDGQNLKAVRNYDTTNAFKQALGLKDQIVSNETVASNDVPAAAARTKP